MAWSCMVDEQIRGRYCSADFEDMPRDAAAAASAAGAGGGFQKREGEERERTPSGERGISLVSGSGLSGRSRL